jgi:hypothetical protein
MHVATDWLMLQDNSAVGIRATIAKLNSMLQGYDPKLWAHLEHRNKVRVASCTMVPTGNLIGVDLPQCDLMQCRSIPSSMLSDG